MPRLKTNEMIKEQIFSEIREEMEKNGTWGEVAHFSCYTDNIFVYKIEKDGILTNLEIIADDCFFSSENPIELLRKKRIGFFEHSVYIKNGDKHEKIGSKCYRPIGECDPN